jgi:type I restriction enzyme S subunit
MHRTARREEEKHAAWPQARLGDHIDLLTGFPFKSETYSENPTDIPLLRGDNIGQGSLRWTGVKRWPEKFSTDYSIYKLQEGDVVLAMDRPWIEAGLKFAAVSRNDLPALLVQRVARLRGSKSLGTNFLRYVIASKQFTNHILAVQTGTGVPHISSEQIKSFRFSLPPLLQQRAIAEVLGALDAKVEMNRRMNETLEAIASAIFKSWFVDCDMPDFLNGLALQKFPPTGEGDLPVIKIADLRRGDTKGSDLASGDMPSEYVVDDGDVLFSWSGSLEVVIWCGGKGALNQHLFKVTSRNYPRWFYYFWIKEHLRDFRAIAASKATTMGHIQRHHLTEAQVGVPSDKLVKAGDALIAPMLNRMICNNLESRTLATIRDALLPKLISGEIRTRDAAAI